MAKKNESYIAASLLEVGSRKYRPGDKIKKIEEGEAKVLLRKGMIYCAEEDGKIEISRMDAVKEENEALKAAIEELEKQLEEATDAAEKTRNENEALKERIAELETEKSQENNKEKNKIDDGKGE